MHYIEHGLEKICTTQHDPSMNLYSLVPVLKLSSLCSLACLTEATIVLWLDYEAFHFPQCT